MNCCLFMFRHVPEGGTSFPLVGMPQAQFYYEKG